MPDSYWLNHSSITGGGCWVLTHPIHPPLGYGPDLVHSLCIRIHTCIQWDLVYPTASILVHVSDKPDAR